MSDDSLRYQGSNPVPANSGLQTNDAYTSPLSSYAANFGQPEAIETLEVRSETQPQVVIGNQPGVPVMMPSLNFSKRRALVVSLFITFVVVIISAVSLSFLARKTDEKTANRHPVPSQDLQIPGATQIAPELQGDAPSLLVNGDVITKGNLRVTEGSFVSILRTQTLSGDQTIQLPDSSGVICLDGNNCDFATQAELANLESQLGQIVIPTIPDGVTSLNSRQGAVVIQGTTNQISVTTSGGTIRLATPQDLGIVSSPTFASLVLSGNANIGGNLTLSLDCSGLLNGGALTTNGSGQVICSNDEGGAGAGVTTGGGTPGTIPVFTTPTNLEDSLLSQALGTVTINGDLEADSLTLVTPLSVPNGGTGVSSFAANGVLYGNGSGSINVTAAPGAGQVLLGNGSGVPTFTGLSGDIALTGAGLTTVQANSVALGVDTIGNYVADVTAGNGINIGGAAGEGWTASVSVAVQANKGLEVDGSGLSLIDCVSGEILKYNGSNQWACAADTDTDTGAPDNAPYVTVGNNGSLSAERSINPTGNLTGTDGGANGSYSIDTVNNPTFTSSVTTPLLQSSGALSITPGGALTVGAAGQTALLQGSTTTITSSGAGNDIILTTADQIRLTGFNCTGFANGGVLTTDASGNISCQDDNGDAASGITGTGNTNRIALFTGAQTIGDSWLLQNGSTLQIDNTRNLEILGGNFIFAGDTFDELVGTGLTVSSGDLQTTLGTSVDLTAEVNGILPVGNGGTGVDGSSAANGTLLIGNGSGYTLATLTQSTGITVTNGSGSISIASTLGVDIDSSEIVDLTITGADIANDTIALGTKTTGNYQAGTSGGNGIAVSGTAGEGWTAAVGLSDLTANWTQTGAFDIVLDNAGSELSILESSGSFYGTLDVGDLTADRTYTLPDYTTGTGTICLDSGNCAGTGGGVTGSGNSGRLAVFTGAQTIADSWLLQNGSTLQLDNTRNLELIGGDLTLTGGNLSVTGAQTTSGTVTFSALANGFLEVNGSGLVSVGTIDLGADTNGNYVATIANGNGITGSSASEGGTPTVALGPLTADWVQSGAFDIVYDNADAEMRILESTGATFYGTFDIGDLLADETYTFLQGGTVVTSGNVSSFATTAVTAGTGLTGGGTTGALTLDIGAGNGITVNADDIAVVYGSAANTAVQGNTGITVSAGTNLTGGGSITLGAGGTVTLNVANSPTFSGNVTVQGGTVSLGVASTTTGSLDLYNAGSANAGSVRVASLGQATVYTLPDPGQASVDICLSTGNCAGAGNGITGSGTQDRLAKFGAGGDNITDSTISDDGTNVTTSVDFIIQGGSATLGTATQSGSLVLHDGDGETITINMPDVGTSYSLLMPSAVGSANQCLKAQDGSGTLFWDNCLGGSGGGGVTSIDGQTGPAVTINNATGSSNVITIDDAAADDTTKGIAAFNSTNFSASSGVINTIQGISTSATPQFAALTLTGNLSIGSNSIVTGGATISSSELDVLDSGITEAEVSGEIEAVTAGNGLTGGGSADSVTLDISSANGAIVVNANDIGLTLQTSGNGLSSTTSSGSGLEVLSGGLTLLQGCADNEILKWNETTDVWACAADAGGSGLGDNVSLNGTGATDANFLDTAASASVASTTWSLATASNPDDITLAIGTASATEAGIVTANAQTFGGAKTFNGQITAGAGVNLGTQTLQGTTAIIDFNNFDVSSGGAVTAVGVNAGSGLLQGTGGITVGGTVTFSSLTNGFLEVNGSGVISVGTIDLGVDTDGNYVATITSGNGTSATATGEGSTPTIALSNLTADWLQSGAFDIVLDDSGSELKIKEAGATPTFYAILDTADLAADQTFILNQGGTVVTSGNVSSYATTGVTAGSGLTGGGTTGGLTLDIASANGGIVVNANDIALTLQANKGLEVDANGLSLIDCAQDEILKYNGSNQWACAADAGGSGVGDDVTVNSTAATNANFLDVAGTGTSTATTWNLATGPNPDDITLAIGNASATEAGAVTTGAQTFAGSKTFNNQIVAGGGINLGTQTLQGTTAVIDFNNFDVSSAGAVTAVGVNAGSGLLQGTGGLTVSGTVTLSSLTNGFLEVDGSGVVTVGTIDLGTDTNGNYVATITAGNGISGSSATEGGTPTVALSNLTADWLQSGAFDITLDNSSSELKIRESSGAFYAILDVSDLTADQTFTLNEGGTVVTSGNVASYATTAVSAGNGLTGGGTVGALTLNTVSANGGIVVNANDIALTLQTNKGLEVDANGLSLIDCAQDQILKYNGSNQWACAADAGGSGLGDSVSVNGTAATDANFLDTAASGTVASTTWSLATAANPDDVTLVIGTASGTEAGILTANAQTLGGAKTFNGQITAGAGVNLGTQTLQGTTAVINFDNFDVSSAGAVTAVGVNAGSGLLQGTGGLTVGGTVTLSSLTNGFLEVNGSGVVSVGTIDLGTDTNGNYVATITSGNGISATATGEGSTPTVALANLTADWLQSSAFDITLDNSSSELKIRESSGAFYAILDVSDIAADQTFTLSEGGTVVTSGNIGSHATTGVSAGNGLTGGGTVGALTLNIGAGNGVTVNANDITLALQANKGLEVDGNGLSLIDCTQDQILKYNGSNQWSCSDDAGGSGVGDDVSVNGSAAANANFINTAASGTVAGVTWSLNTTPTPDEISLTVGTASATEAGIITTGAQIFGGAKTFNGNVTIGNTSTLSDLILHDGNGQTTTVRAGDSIASQTLVLPTSLGNASQCIKNSATPGVLEFSNCNNGSGTGGAITLQDAYDASGTPASILLATGKNLVITSPEVATDPSVLINLQCTSCSANGGRFAVQSAGTDAFTVNPNGTIVVAGLTTLNGGLTLETGDIFTFNGDAFTDLTGNGLIVSSNVLTIAVQANKGLEVDGNGLSLIDCAQDQILKYNGSNQWACAADAGAGGTGDDISVNGSTATNANFINTAASGTVAAVTWSLNTTPSPDEISLTVGAASATEAGIITNGAQTLAGNKTFSNQIVANGGIDLAAQTLQGTTAVIDFTNFDVTSGGNTTIAGTLAVQGASTTIGGASQQGSLVLHDGSGETLTIRSLNQTANRIVEIPIATSNDTVCLLSLGNCFGSGTGGTLQAAYNADVDGSDVRIDLTTADDSLIFSNPAASGSDSSYVLEVEQLATSGTKGGLFIDHRGDSYALRVDDSSSDTTPFIIGANGNVGIGTTNAFYDLTLGGNTNRTIALGDSGGETPGNELTIRAGDSGTMLSIQDGGRLRLTGGSGADDGSGGANGGDVLIYGGSGTGGVGVSGDILLAYDGTSLKGNVGIGLATPSALLHISGAGSGNPLLRVTDTTATAQNVLNIADGGATALRNQTNSTSAFLVQNSAGGQLFNIDSSNSNITLNGLNSGELQAWATNGNSLPAARTGHSSIVANGYVYVMGGDNSGVQSTVYYAKLNADGSTGTWSTNANALPDARNQHSSIVANGYVYVIGGLDTSCCLGTSTVYYAKLNADGSTGSWSTNANALPASRWNHSSVVANGFVYVFGGNGGSVQSTVYYAKLNADGSTGSWSTNANALPAGRQGTATVVANGYVYVMGGDNSGVQSTVYYAKLNADGSTGSWSTNANALPAGRNLSTSVIANGYVYVMGGFNSGAQSTVYYSSLNADGSTGTWSTNANALPVAMNTHSSVTANGYVYAMYGTGVYYASTARVKIGGSLDLIGLGGENLNEGNGSSGSTAGSLTAGNTFVSGWLNVTDAASFAGTLSVDKELAVRGNVLFRNDANSTTALQVQNAAGTNLLVADTTNSRIYIGNPTADSTGALLVLDTKNTSGDPTGVNGAMYYNSNANKFRCFENSAWLDCTSGGTTLQQAYNNDTDGSDAIIPLTTADDSIIIRNPASAGSDSTYPLTVDQLNTGAFGGLFINSLGTGYALRVDDSSSDTTPFVINQDGKVGIGTSAPDVDLHIARNTSSANYGDYPAITLSNTDVNGPAAILFNRGSGAANVQGILQLDSAEQLLLGTRVSTALKFRTADTDRAQITSTGEFLIGHSTASTYALDVQDNQFEVLRLRAGANSHLTVQGNPGTGGSFVLNSTGGNGDFIFGTGDPSGNGVGTELVRLTSAGSLGVGDSTPDALLDVAGSFQFDGNGVLGDTNTDTLTVNAVLQGASPLVFEGATADANEVTISVADPLSGDRTYTIPNSSASTDTFCLLTLNNCSGSATTLQTSYNADADGSDTRIDLTAADDSLIFSNPAASGSDSSYVLEVEQLATSGTKGSLFVDHRGDSFALRVDDESGDTTPFVIDASGQVGIGTASPTATLHVAGANGTTAGTGGAAPVALRVVGGTGGNGTSGPGGVGADLVLSAGTGGNGSSGQFGGNGGNISITAGNGGDSSNLVARPNGGSITLQAGSQGTGGNSDGINGNINLQTSNGVVNITGSRVGINISNPNAAFEVLSTTANSAYITADTGATAYSTTSIMQGLTIRNTNTNSTGFVGILFASSAAANSGSATIGAVRTGNDQNALVFATRCNGCSTTERVRISEAGYLGVGTASPGAMLSVGASNQFQVDTTGNITASGNITSTGNHTFSQGANRTISVAQASSGNGYNLTVQAGMANAGGTGGDLNLNGGSGGSGVSPGGSVRIQGGASGNGTNGGNVYIDGGTTSGTPGNVILTSVTTGRVGVTDTTPDYKFELQGSSGSGYFAITNSSDGDILEVDTSGNVGIADTTPDARLDVELASTSTTAATERGYELRVTDTGVVTTGTDTTYGQQLTIVRTGATGGTINSYGLDIQGTGDTGGTSTLTGLNVNVSGADTNYAALFQGGGVGVGTAIPTARLHVSSGTAENLFVITDSNGTSADVLTIADDGQTTFRNKANSTSAFAIQSSTAGNELFQVDTSNSRVYIGDPTADATGALLVLDTKNTTGDPTGLNGAMYYNSFDQKFKCYENSAWVNCITAASATTLQQTYNADADGSDSRIDLTTADDSLIFSNPAASGSDSTYVLEVEQLATSGTKGGLFVDHRGDSYALRVDDASADTSPFIIDETGRVGIGTTTADAMLTLTGGDFYLRNTGSTPLIRVYNQANSNWSEIRNTGSGSNSEIYLVGGGGIGLLVNNNGHVGIGTTTPTGALQVNALSNASTTQYQNNSAALLLSNTNTTDNNWVEILFADDSAGNALSAISTLITDHTNNYGELRFSTKDAGGLSTRMTIGQNGNVGIGDTSPDYKLEIQGSSGSGYFAITNSTDGDILAVNSSGDATFGGNVTIAAQKTLRLIGGTTAQRPGSPSEGQIYFDTDTKQLLVYGGGAWQNMSRSSTKVVAASNSQTPAGADYQVTSAEETAGNADSKIQAAIDALPAGGGTVYLMEGTYTIDTGIDVPSNVTITGAGTSTVIKLRNSHNAGIAMIGDKNATDSNITIRDLTIDGNRANQTSGTTYGIQMFDVGSGSGTTALAGVTVKNVTVKDVRTYGIFLQDSPNSLIDGNKIINTAGAAFGGSIYLTISSSDDARTVISNNAIHGSGYYGIYLGSPNVIVDSNVIEGSTIEGIYVEYAYNTITNNLIRGGLDDGIDIDGDYSTVTGNTVSDNAFHGIFVRTNGSTISGNTLYNNGTSGSSDSIRVSSGDSNIITSNNITDTSCAATCYAINISNAGSDNNYLADNRYSGTGATGINDSGTGTVYANQARGANGAQLTIRTGNDTAALQVQNATGTDVLTVDTTNSQTILRGTNSIATLGSEKVTNGSFTGDASGWTLGTGWAYNSNNVTKTAGTASDLEQNISAVSGEVYQITFSITSWTAGCLSIELGGVTKSGFCSTTFSDEEVITATSTGNLKFKADSSFAGTVDGISVVRISATNAVLMVKNADNTTGLEIRSGGQSSFANTFVGRNSGQYAQAGTLNTALGVDAMQHVIDMSNNTAIGARAMQYALYGFDNVAIGLDSMRYLDSGNDNVAVGNFSLEDIGNGNDNVAIGTSALNNTTTGNRNTALGDQAGARNTTGSNNIFIGHRAGNNDTFGWNTGQTLTNAGAIGAFAQVQASNSLVLGGQGTNQVNVGIGTTVPSNTLSVSPFQYYDGSALASQSGTTVTGTGTTAFTSAMVGNEIVFLDGTKATITAFTNSTTVTVTPSQTVASQKFRVHYTGFQVTNTGNVGVGIATPTAKLEVVNGSGTAKTLVVNNSTSTGNILEVQDNGSAIITVADGGDTSIVGNVTISTDKYLRVTGGTTANRPASPAEGMIFYDQTLDQLLVYANGKWQADRTTATKIVAASDSQNKEKADYVADGNTGAADDGDQVEVNAAINALPSAGGAVVLLEGTYTIDNSIIVKNGTTLTGSGYGTAIQLPASWTAAIDMIKNDNPGGAGNYGITIRDLHLVGSNGSGGNIMDGIQFTKVGPAGNGLGATIQNIYTFQIKDSNINITDGYNNIISGNHLESGGYGIVVVNGGNNIINGNKLIGMGTGINLYASDTNTVTSNNIPDTVTNEGILIEAGADDNTIADNYVYTSASDGIEINASHRNLVDNNGVNDSNNHGINVHSNSDNNSITGNRITDTAGTSYAITIAASTENGNYLSDNFFSGTYTGTGFNDAGTGTIFANQATALDGGNLTNSNLFIEDKLALGVQTLTITDDGTANDTLTPSSSYVRIAIDETANVGVPTLAISETGAREGDLLIIVNYESDGSHEGFTITDSAGVAQLAGNFAPSDGGGEYDVITLIYTNDGTTSQWTELSRSAN